MPEIAAAWFPLYPLLVRAVEFFVRDYQVASVLVSNGCLIAAALLLMRLLRLDYDELVCRRAIIFLMFNPVSFFLSSAYTESTFLLLSIGALLAARQGKWLIAALSGVCLSATRAPGLLIGAPLFAEYLMQWRERGGNVRAFFRPHLFLLALVPAGLVAYLFYLYLRARRFLPADARSGQRLGENPDSALAIISLAEQFSCVTHSTLPSHRRRGVNPGGSWLLVARAADLSGLRGRVAPLLPGVGQPGRIATLCQHSLSSPSHPGPAIIPMEMALRTAPGIFHRVTGALHCSLRKRLPNDLREAD